MFGFALLALIVVVVLLGISSYNRLVGLKNQVANAWKQIDVQLKRRHDLIPNLINTVKGAMNFERTPSKPSSRHETKRSLLRRLETSQRRRRLKRS